MTGPGTWLTQSWLGLSLSNSPRRASRWVLLLKAFADPPRSAAARAPGVAKDVGGLVGPPIPSSVSWPRLSTPHAYVLPHPPTRHTSQERAWKEVDSLVALGFKAAPEHYNPLIRAEAASGGYGCCIHDDSPCWVAVLGQRNIPTQADGGLGWVGSCGARHGVWA